VAEPRAVKSGSVDYSYAVIGLPTTTQKIRPQEIDKGHEQMAAGTVAGSVIMFE